jgi:hypothetical protein
MLFEKHRLQSITRVPVYGWGSDFLTKFDYKEWTMKIVSLCKDSCCCPMVKIMDNKVEIGENENTCVLTRAEWETLKEKILCKEL